MATDTPIPTPTGPMPGPGPVVWACAQIDWECISDMNPQEVFDCTAVTDVYLSEAAAKAAVVADYNEWARGMDADRDEEEEADDPFEVDPAEVVWEEEDGRLWFNPPGAAGFTSLVVWPVKVQP